MSRATQTPLEELIDTYPLTDEGRIRAEAEICLSAPPLLRATSHAEPPYPLMRIAVCYLPKDHDGRHHATFQWGER